MAKKDGEDFNDDLDLSSFDDMGDFTKEGYDEFAMDEEKDRKPAKGFVNSALFYGNKAKDGAVEGLKQKIADEFPNADKFVDDVKSGIATVTEFKEDFVKGLTPELNQSKLLIRQLANRTKGILPDSIYKKILEKTEVEKKETAVDAEKAREEGRNNSLNETLNSIFTKQMAAADANQKEEAISKVYDRRVSEMQHNASMGALADLRIQSHFQSTFLRTTLTAWMKKDLELKIRTMYLQEDSLIALKKQNEILVQKLDAIRHNTALPEVDKINLKERIQKQAYDVALQSMTNFFGNYAGAVKQKFKQNVLEPLKDTFSTLLDAASTSMEMMPQSSGGSLKQSVKNFLFSFLGKQVGKAGGQKLINMMPEELRTLIEASADGGIDEMKLMGGELAKGQVPLKLQPFLSKNNEFSKSGKSILKTIAETLLPTAPTEIGSIRNSVYSEPEAAAKFTNKFTTTVEEVIPGYLRMQVRLLEAIANSDAVKANIRVTEEKFFDAKNREFVTSSVMDKRLENRLYGTDEERATSLAVTANTISNAMRKTKIDDTKRMAYLNDQADIALIINSLATAKNSSVSSLGPEQVAWLIAFINSRGNRAQALKKIDPLQRRFAESFFEYAFDKTGLIETKTTKDLIRIANAIVGITGSNSGDILGSATIQKLINKRMYGLMQEQDIYAQRFEKELNTQVGGFASSDLAKNYFTRNEKTGERVYGAHGLEINKDEVLSKYSDARNRHQDIVEANLALNNANKAHWNAETGKFEYEQKTGFAKFLDDAFVNSDEDNSFGNKVKNYIKKTSEKILFRDDSVSDKIAKKMGFGKKYQNFKNDIKSMSVDGMLKFFGTSKKDLKERASKIGNKALSEGYRRVFDYMVKSKNVLLHDLAKIMFEENNGTISLQKRNDVKDLAALLSSEKYYKGMDIRSLLHTISSQDDFSSLGQWANLINIFLPEQLKAIGQMSDEDYEKFIDIDSMEKRVTWLKRYLSKHINKDEANIQDEIEEVAARADEQEEKMEGPGKQARKRARREAKDKARQDRFFAEHNIKTEESATEKKADEQDEAVKSSTGKAGGPDDEVSELKDKFKSVSDQATESVKKAYKNSKTYAKNKYEEFKNSDVKDRFKDTYEEVKESSSNAYGKAKGLFGRISDRIKSATTKATSAASKYIAINGIKKILKDQLTVLNAILVAVSEKGAFGSGYGKVMSAAEKMSSKVGVIKKGFFPAIGRVLGAASNAVWQSTVAATNLSFNTLKAASSILRHSLTNRICDVYIAPANVDDKQWPEPKEINLKISEKQFELGVYSDRKAKKRLKSVADIRGPVYDANGSELITKEDIKRGLVDINGKPISNWAARIGRMIYKSGGWTLNTTVDLVTGTLRQIGPHALNLFRKSLSSPFRILESSFNKYFDVYRKDDMSRPLITARDQEDGRVVYTNGDKIKRTTEIKSPVVWANMDPPQFAISDEDLKAGLVDAHGQPINALSRKIGNIINWGGDIFGRGVSLFTHGYLSVLKWTFDKAKKGLHALFKKKYPYISVYLADDNNNWDPNNPVMKGIDIRNGKFCYEDGTIIKSAYGITKPVYRILDDGSMDLVVKADEVDHLVDIEGKRLTAFAGRSIIGKGFHIAWGVTKWGIKKALRGAKRLVDLGRKGINFITKGMWNMLTDTTGLIYGGLKDILGTVFHGDTLLNRKDLETIVGERLEKIYKLLDYRLPGKPISGDADGDGDRDNGYQDQKEQSEKRKKKYEDTKKAREQAKQEKKDKEEAKKAAAAAGGSSSDGGSSWSDWLTDIFMGKSIAESGKDALGSLKKSKWGRRIGGIGTLLGKATRGLGKAASYFTKGKVGATLGEKGALKTTGEMFSKGVDALKGKAGTFFGKGGAGSAAAAKMANSTIGQKIIGKRMANIVAKRGLASAVHIGGRIAATAAGRVASTAIPVLGQILGIATVVALGSNALVWAGSKLHDAMFGSKNEHELLDIRRKGYGTTKEQDSIIEDLEEDVIDAFDLKRGPLTDDELEDYAERFGILSAPKINKYEKKLDEMREAKIAKRRAYMEAKAAAKDNAKASGKAPAKVQKPKLDQATIDELMPDTKAQRQEYFNAWLVGRAQEVLKAYYGIVRWFTQTKQGDDFDPDDIPENVRNQAAATLDKAIKQLLAKNNTSQLVLTEEGYQKWRALYAGKIKHQKAKDGTDGRTSEEVSKLYGGAASVGSSEEKTASKWKSWRDTISGKGLREWASKRSWWNPLKYAAYAVSAVGWVADFLVNGTIDLVMDSAIGDWLKSMNTAYNKGGGFLGAVKHFLGGSRSDKEQAWFEARMQQYGWKEVGSDVSYDTENAITDLEKEEFKIMGGERKPIDDDELKDFGIDIGFLEKSILGKIGSGISGMFNSAVNAIASIGGGYLFSMFGTDQKEKTEEVIKVSSQAIKEMVKDVKDKALLKKIAEIDSQETRFKYLKAWYIGRFTPSYAAYADVVVKAGEQELGEEPDPNKIPEFRMSEALQAFLRNAAQHCNKDALQLCPNEQTYRIWIEAQVKELVDKYKAETRKTETEKKLATSPNAVAKQKAVPVSVKENKDDENKKQASTGSKKSNEKEDAKENKTKKKLDLSNLKSPNTVPKEDDKDKTKLGDGVKSALVTLDKFLHPMRTLAGWWFKFLGRDGQSAKLELARFDAYGFDDKHAPAARDALLELEKKIYPTIENNNGAGQLDDKYLEDFAKDIGFQMNITRKFISGITNFFKDIFRGAAGRKDAWEARQTETDMRREYLRNWFDSRFYPILGSYYNIMKAHKATEVTIFGKIKVVPDKMTPEEFDKAFKEFKSAIDKILSNKEVKDLIPTEEGFKAFAEARLKATKQAKHKGKSIDDRLLDEIKDEKDLINQRKKDNEHADKLKNAVNDAQENTRKQETKKEESKGWFSNLTAKAKSGLTAITDWMGITDSTAEGIQVPKPKQVNPTETSQRIWKFFKSKGWTDEGVAALMGNLDKESTLRPVQLQGDLADSNRTKSMKYVAEADKNKRNFTKGQIGFGIAQWTTPDRKENLWNYAQSKGKSVGDLDTQLEFLNDELETKYKGVVAELKNAKDVGSAAVTVLKKFEVARDRNLKSEQDDRASRAMGWYKTYAGKELESESSTETASSTTPTSTSTDSIGNSSSAPGSVLTASDNGSVSTSSPMAAAGASDASTDNSNQQAAQTATAAFEKTGIVPDSDSSTENTNKGETNTTSSSESSAELKKVVNVGPGVDIENEHPLLKTRFAEMAKEFKDKFGHAPTITGGKRSLAKQAKLYQELGPARAAKPQPYAPHIAGLALDAMSKDMEAADNSGLLAKHGLWRPLKNWKRTKEPWHVEVMGSRDPRSGVITKETLDKINQQGGGTVSPSAGSNDGGAITTSTGQSIPQTDSGKVSEGSVASGTSSGNMETSTSSTSTPSLATTSSGSDVNVANPGASASATTSSMEQPNPMVESFNSSEKSTAPVSEANNSEDLKGIQQELTKISSLLESYLEENKKGVDSMVQIASTMSASDKVNATSGTGSISGDAIASAIAAAMGPGSDFAKMLQSLTSENTNMSRKGYNPAYAQSGFNPVSPISVSRSM